MGRLELYDVDHDSCLLALPLEELADQTAYPHLLILPQSRTEKLLLDALGQEPTAAVRFSCEVTKLVPHQENVDIYFQDATVEAKVTAQLVAGCDGAHSNVREAIQARLEGSTYSVRAALADIQLSNNQAFHSPRLTTQPRLAIGIEIAQGLWRMILPFRESEEMPLDQRVEDAARRLFPDHTWQLVWQSEFRLHNRVSTTFTAGRIVLAGDAAHLNSPVGGQGMNAGIQDAALLTKAMVDALEHGRIEPLIEYGRQRRQAVQKGVNQFTDLLTRTLLSGQGRLFRPMLAIVNVATGLPPLRRRIMRRLAMLE